MSIGEQVRILRAALDKLDEVKEELWSYVREGDNHYASQDLVSPMHMAAGRLLREIEFLETGEEE